MEIIRSKWNKVKKMEFSKDEMYEIEKAFDERAGQVKAETARILQHLAPSKSEKAVKLANKIIDNAVDAYDLCRTISAKCQHKRLKDDKSKNRRIYINRYSSYIRIFCFKSS